MKFIKDTSRISGILFFLLSAWVIYTASRFSYTGSDHIGPGDYPTALGVATLVLSALLVVMGSGRKKSGAEEQADAAPLQWKSLFVTIAAIIVYLSVFDIIGFVLSTLLFLFGLSMYYDRTRWKTAILYSVGFTAVLFVVFKLVLKILLPTIWL